MKKREIKKITDMEKIEALYKEGSISRTTFWRAKKRGWIAYKYHTKKKVSNSKLSEKEQIQLYFFFRKFTRKYLEIWSEQDIAAQLAPDVASKAYLHILEIQPNNIKHAIKRGVLYIKQIVHRDKEFRSFVPTREKELERNLHCFSSI